MAQVGQRMQSLVKAIRERERERERERGYDKERKSERKGDLDKKGSPYCSASVSMTGNYLYLERMCAYSEGSSETVLMQRID